MSAVESWFAPAAAVAETLPKPRTRRSAPATAKPKRQQQRRARNLRVRAPLVYMVVLAVMLVGVVAVNVAVMRAHVSTNDLDTKIAQLQQGNAKLASQYASMTAAPRVAQEAAAAGLVPASGLVTTYLDMTRRTVRHK
ncbi:MAG TPA: hypothetical protein VGH79_10145 [Gaiellaceae bacterium]|jgi:cell division protein FtsL